MNLRMDAFGLVLIFTLQSALCSFIDSAFDSSGARKQIFSNKNIFIRI